jgi:hypothetical protein
MRDKIMDNLEYKIVRKKKLDKELTVKILKNVAAERILVEFSSKDGKMIVQKSFQDNYHYGREEAKVFENAFKSINDLKVHFNNKREKQCH